ncbi:MAG: vanillate O-demethylase oxidoreductase VanB [Proteobacteria bacterium]|nr:MAG: vanillate O-demethylase oxidoreductase VanB [Pseudomonadota bacterium]
MTDRIVKQVELQAPVSRVWRALTDHEEFGQWFRVKLDGPFKPGALSTGQVTYPGYEHYPWRAVVERMEPERLFSFRWNDFDEKSGLDISEQPSTLVEFRLEPTDTGTRLTIIESGFESLPDHRRLEVLRSNTEGWDIQANNIAVHVTAPT